MFARLTVVVAALGVALCAVAATAHGLYAVAAAARVPQALAWLYPPITDGLAIVAYAATHLLRTATGKRYAWTVVVVAAALSGLAQAAYLEAGAAVQVAPALAFGVGAWPAVAAAVAAHLMYLLLTSQATVEAALGIAPGGTVADLIDAQEDDPDRGVIISSSSVRTCVYRLVDAAGQLLYVGVTSNLAKRLQVHRASRSWWPDVAEVLTEDYPDRASALAVEQSAIANEKPSYNINGGGLRDCAGGAGDPNAFVDGAAYVLGAAPSGQCADDSTDGDADANGDVKLRRLHTVPDEDSGRTASGARMVELAQDPAAWDRVRDIVAGGRGRAAVMREFDLSEHQARQLLKAVRDDFHREFGSTAR